MMLAASVDAACLILLSVSDEPFTTDEAMKSRYLKRAPGVDNPRALKGYKNPSGKYL